jgi:FdhD protein
VRGSIVSTPVQRFGGVPALARQDWVAVEEPLQIRIGEHDVSITMRTPGNDPELAAGFLFTEGIVCGREDIARIDCGNNQVTVELVQGVEIDPERWQRNFYISSSCGVCGKASIQSLEAAGCTILPRGVPQIAESVIVSLPGKIRESQTVFEQTGGLHAAALFSTQGELIALREDVGRHNALDKLVGRLMLEGPWPAAEHALMVSGRTSFELVQKAAMARIPVIAAVGAPSSLAVQTAIRFGMTLIGFLREDRFNVYAGVERVCGASKKGA